MKDTTLPDPLGGKRYVVARLGKAGGKMKYTLLDERDISLTNDHIFEARLEIDKNGNGASIFAYAFCQFNKGSRSSARYLHELVWERHAVPIAPGFTVMHKNRITMDNRFENLHIVPHNRRRYLDPDKIRDPGSKSETTMRRKQLEQSLYWSAIQQLPLDPVIDETCSASDTSGSMTGGNKKFFVDVTCQTNSNTYFECHFAPCIKIEGKPREFSICGRCREARYCGSTCQQKDWRVHKKYCREKPRRHSPYTFLPTERMNSTVNKQLASSTSSSLNALRRHKPPER